MNAKQEEKNLRKYGLAGENLRAVMEDKADFDYELDRVFKKAIQDCQDEINSANRMAKAEKILNKFKQ